MNTMELAANMDTKSIALSQSDLGVEDLLAGDIKIPRAMLLQKMSKMVEEEKGKSGEIRGSLEANLLGGVDKAFLFVPIYMHNTWIISEATTKKYVSQEPRTAANDKLPWEFTGENGTPMTRTKCINVFLMALSELESGEALPYQLTFRGMSFDAGKTLTSIIAKLMLFKKPIYNYVFSITSLKKENDKGTFFVFDLTRAKGTDEKPIALSDTYTGVCAHWMNQVKNGRVTVDVEAEIKETLNESVPF